MVDGELEKILDENPCQTQLELANLFAVTSKPSLIVYKSCEEVARSLVGFLMSSLLLTKADVAKLLFLCSPDSGNKPFCTKLLLVIKNGLWTTILKDGNHRVIRTNLDEHRQTEHSFKKSVAMHFMGSAGRGPP